MSIAAAADIVIDMDRKLSLPQRLVGAGAALVLTLFLAVVAATPAHALCPIDQDCGPQPVDYISTLTITPPANGQVTVTAPDGSPTTCSTAQPAPCAITDVQTTLSRVRPATGWPTYTLSWSGSHATWDGWSGACSGLGDCSVTNDQASKTVTATTHVAPTAVTVNRPDRVFADSVFSASATGDLGPFTFEWAECGSGGLFATCVDRSVTRDSYFSSFPLAGLADGTWDYRLFITDVLGNKSVAQAMTFTVQGLGLHVSDLPALSTTPSLTYSADDPNVTAFQCSATPQGTPSAPWTPCPSGADYAPQLTDGTWLLSVRALGALGATEVITRTTTVDTTAPAVTFGSGPAEHATIAAGNAQLAFTSTDAHPGTTTCTADSVPVTPCATPIAMTDLGNGAHTVVVTSTDAVGNAASARRDFTVRLPSKVTAGNVVTSYGRTATLLAHLSPSTADGTVAFVSSGRTLCTAPVAAGIAKCTAPASLNAGRHTITARYAGGYAASSTTFTVTVDKAATRIGARAARATVHRGQRETITATGIQAGTVTVSRAGHLLCRGAAVRTTARCGFAAAWQPGRYVLTVRYGGNPNYLASQTTVRVRVIR